jgi:hypothetical protein
MEGAETGTVEPPEAGTVERAEAGTAERAEAGTVECAEAGMVEPPEAGMVERAEAGMVEVPEAKMVEGPEAGTVEAWLGVKELAATASLEVVAVVGSVGTVVVGAPPEGVPDGEVEPDGRSEVTGIRGGSDITELDGTSATERAGESDMGIEEQDI